MPAFIGTIVLVIVYALVYIAILLNKRKEKKTNIDTNWEKEKRDFENHVGPEILYRREQFTKELMDDKSETRRRQAIIKRNRLANKQ